MNTAFDGKTLHVGNQLLSNSNQQCQFVMDHVLLEDPGFETLKTVIYQKWLEKDQLSTASSKDGLGTIK